MQATRSNRIPRITAARPGLCRRLHKALKARYLRWKLRSKRAQLDRIEAAMAEATEMAIAMARTHRHSAWLQEQRREMRETHEELAQEWLVTRQDLDAVEALELEHGK